MQPPPTVFPGSHLRWGLRYWIIDPLYSGRHRAPVEFPREGFDLFPIPQIFRNPYRKSHFPGDTPASERANLSDREIANVTLNYYSFGTAGLDPGHPYPNTSLHKN